ncbi:MAG: DUF4012 domain-containing protein [Candidatus Moraniibacteriota bacterium]
MQQNKRPQNRIIQQMFDVRPVDKAGNLDLEKINQIRRVSKIGFSGRVKIAEKKVARIPAFHDIYESTPQEDEIRRFQKFIEEEREDCAFSDKPAKASGLRNIHITHATKVESKKTIAKEKSIYEMSINPVYESKAVNREPAKRYSQKEIKHPMPADRNKYAAFSKYSSIEKSNQVRLVPPRSKVRKPLLIRKKVAKTFHSGMLAIVGFVKIIIAIFFNIFAKTGKLIAAITKSFFASIRDFFEILNNSRRRYYGYIDESIRKRNTFSFFAAATCVFILVFGVGFFYRSLKIKSLAMENGKIAYASLNEAKEGIKKRDFDDATFKFNDAYERFDMIQKDIDSLGSVIVESSRFIPYLSKLSSGSNLSEAGKNISRIGVLATEIMKNLNSVKNPLDSEDSISYLKLFQESDKNLTEIALRINDLAGNLDKINIEDIPEAQRSRFVDLKKKMPEINKFVTSFSEEEKILADVLGGNGPRKYLFLFQNNQEMRATGGFIGTYAVLDIFDGNVRSFFVDGIFNPDGQLREKVIPPAPIQKISAAWSLHDSNWFPDFPMSAEKASWFYEKTGGPTVDGVITMTPTVMQKLLEITGPIEMPDYGVTIDKDNFLESIQYEVEVDYDKELNQPKKILADLAPKILDRIFNTKNFADITKTMDVLLTSLNEKHILIYSKNYDVEKMLSANGWSGEVLDTDKDYLSVINTNINGYKTDGVIDETISHKAEIQNDGSIIDTVTITRQHNGGDTPHDWWNRVNADYMRVYVPKGSTLIRASGETNEFNSPPIDYRALGFKKDAQVGMEEDSMIIDADSGTRIYEDSGKTVFANWVYVSPQEAVTMSYSYLLPFKLDTNLTVHPADTYSLLAQKQSGSVGSKFSTKITFPNFYKMIWKYPSEEISNFSTGDDKNSGIEMESDLKTDKFIGVAFEKNNQ